MKKMHKFDLASEAKKSRGITILKITKKFEKQKNKKNKRKRQKSAKVPVCLCPKHQKSLSAVQCVNKNHNYGQLQIHPPPPPNLKEKILKIQSFIFNRAVVCGKASREDKTDFGWKQRQVAPALWPAEKPHRQPPWKSAPVGIPLREKNLESQWRSFLRSLASEWPGPYSLPWRSTWRLL